MKRRSVRELIDTLSGKMKAQEKEYTTYLDQSKYTIIRVDGKNFSTYTRRYEKPCDDRIKDAMIHAGTALSNYFKTLCCYIQSDEISILIDRNRLEFKGCAAKYISLASSVVTASFNRDISSVDMRHALFDARVFQFDKPMDVYWYFHWRRIDCFRNGVGNCYRELNHVRKSVTTYMAKKYLESVEGAVEKYKYTLFGTFIKCNEDVSLGRDLRIRPIPLTWLFSKYVWPLATVTYIKET